MQGNIGDVGNSNWKDPDVIAVNKFRKAMEGFDENVTKVSDKVIMIERTDQGVTKGVVIVNLGDGVTGFNEASTLAAGSYTNCSQNGGIFTSNGTTLSGNLPKGITILYAGGSQEPAVNFPKVSIDKENCSFYDTLNLTLHVTTGASASYSIEGGTETEYTDGQIITIGEGVAAGTQIKVTVKASNTDGDASEDYLYTKKDASSSATIYFKKPSGWTIPYVYIYNDYNETNGAWPGVKMTKIGTDFYKYELTGWADAKVKINDNYDGNSTDALNLAMNGQMVYDDGTWKAYDSSYDSLIDPNVTPDDEVQGTSKVYFKNTQNWPDVNIYFYTNVGGFKQVNGGWPGVAMTDEGNGLFSYTLPKAFEGASILFNTTGGNTQIPASGGFVAPANSTMICVADASGETGTWKEYAEEGTSKVYFRKPSDWGEPNVYAYKIDGNADSKVSQALNKWPGVAMTKVDGTETLYSYTFSSDSQNVNVIFNDGSNQYPSSGGYALLTGESKIYDNGKLRDFTTDDLQEPEETTTEAGVTKVYFKNTDNWSKVKIYYWQDGSPSVDWPGVSMVDEGNNVYSYTLPSGYESAKVIFNNGEGTQTVDLSTQVGSTMEFVPSGTDSGKITGKLVSKSKVYFKNTLGWANIKVHYWQDGGSSTTWPGVSMVNEGDNLYSYTLPDGYENANVIFNNNGKGEQTKTMAAADQKTLIFVPNGNMDSDNHFDGAWRDFTSNDIPNQQETSKTPTVSESIYPKTTTISGTAGSNADITLTVDAQTTTSAGAQVKTEEKEIGSTTADKDGNWSVTFQLKMKVLL